MMKCINILFTLFLTLILTATTLGQAPQSAHRTVVGGIQINQLAQLSASDGTPLGSVAMSGDTVVAGAIEANQRLGAAYVFVRPASGWTDMTETAILTATDSPQLFGRSVAISGNTIVVGAPAPPGKAYVFVKPKTGWTNMTQTAELTPSNPGGSFGETIATDGKTVVVRYNILAYVYVEPAGGWTDMTETAQLGNGNLFLNMGVSLGISEDDSTIVAGDNGCCYNGNSYPGEGDVFVKPATGWVSTWTPNARLTGSDEYADDFFGSSIAISGQTVVVGSIYAANNVGSAYVFVKPASGWTDMTETAELKPSDSGGFFGTAVAIQAGTVAVGAPMGGIGNIGTGYVYFKPAKGWKNMTESLKLTPTPTQQQYYFGSSASISGKAGVGGTASGMAYVFGQP